MPKLLKKYQKICKQTDQNLVPSVSKGLDKSDKGKKFKKQSEIDKVVSALNEQSATSFSELVEEFTKEAQTESTTG